MVGNELLNDKNWSLQGSRQIFAGFFIKYLNFLKNTLSDPVARILDKAQHQRR